MANPGDVQYRMKCTVCGQVFVVDRVSSKVPRHPQKGQTEQAGVAYVPCTGTGLGGIVAGTKMKTLDQT